MPSNHRKVAYGFLLKCRNTECATPQKTIQSTVMDGAIFPSKLGEVTLFNRTLEDKWKSWDEDGGLRRYERYAPVTGPSCPPSNRLQPRSQKQESHFTYRGMFIDLSRNWFPVHQSKSLNYDDFLEFVIDIAAELELTHLHLHLSDDQGWRIQIPGLPELTDFGAHRCFGNFGNTDFPCLYPAPQDTAEGDEGPRFIPRYEFVALLQYADKRGVKIVPEIDMPAHSRAAVKCKNSIVFFSSLIS